jgi:hypothetical protein
MLLDRGILYGNIYQIKYCPSRRIVPKLRKQMMLKKRRVSVAQGVFICMDRRAGLKRKE